MLHRQAICFICMLDHQNVVYHFGIARDISPVNIKHKPASIQKDIDTAIRHIQRRNFSAALSLLEDIIQTNPQYSEAQYLYCVALLNTNQNALALEKLSGMVAENPNDTRILAMMGETLAKLGQNEQAINYYEKTLDLDGKHIEALTGLGALLLTHRLDYPQAIEKLGLASELKPSHHPAHLFLALALAAQDQIEDSFKHGEKAVKLAPKNNSYLVSLANLYQQAGNNQKAAQLLQKALSLDPTYGSAYLALSKTRKFTDADKALIKKMEKALDRPMPPDSRDCIHFSLGKIYDDLGEWEHAFNHYHQGNQLIHTLFDASKQRKETTAIINTCSSAFFKKFAGCGHPSSKPVFIVGMPRSGSTLVDQILSSHPSVYSLGEYVGLWKDIRSLCDTTKNSKPFPHCLPKVSPKNFLSLAEEYLQDIEKLCPDNSTRVSNKQLSNYLALGVIAVAFPNAKIIHVRRHPLDSGLSNYFQRFEYPDTVAWAFDLHNIGTSYTQYARCMHHWEKHLPVPIFDLSYESLIENPEEVSRQLLEYCELEWDPVVLEFYRQRRSVRTASVNQVRQPIHNKSVARWKHYAPHLQPLVTSLGDILKDDTEELTALGLSTGKNQASFFNKLFKGRSR